MEADCFCRHLFGKRFAKDIFLLMLVYFPVCLFAFVVLETELKASNMLSVHSTIELDFQHSEQS